MSDVGVEVPASWVESMTGVASAKQSACTGGLVSGRTRWTFREQGGVPVPHAVGGRRDAEGRSGTRETKCTLLGIELVSVGGARGQEIARAR